MVYGLHLSSPKRKTPYHLIPVGHGDPSAPRQIDTDLSDLDSALKIVSAIEVTLR